LPVREKRAPVKLVTPRVPWRVEPAFVVCAAVFVLDAAGWALLAVPVRRVYGRPVLAWGGVTAAEPGAAIVAANAQPLRAAPALWLRRRPAAVVRRPGGGDRGRHRGGFASRGGGSCRQTQERAVGGVTVTAAERAAAVGGETAVGGCDRATAAVMRHDGGDPPKRAVRSPLAAGAPAGVPRVTAAAPALRVRADPAVQTTALAAAAPAAAAGLASKCLALPGERLETDTDTAPRSVPAPLAVHPAAAAATAAAAVRQSGLIPTHQGRVQPMKYEPTSESSLLPTPADPKNTAAHHDNETLPPPPRDLHVVP